MKIVVKGLICVFLFFLVACTRVTQQNFDKIQTGMTLAQVTSLLGAPSASEGINFMGASATSATWKYKSAAITIIFLNDKVQIKSFATDGNSSQP